MSPEWIGFHHSLTKINTLSEGVVKLFVNRFN